MSLLVDAEVSLGELSGALRVCPREVAEAAVRRMALREASAFLSANVAWIHPCDIAMRMAGSSVQVRKALAEKTMAHALPVTYGRYSHCQRRESIAWAEELDRQLDAAEILVKVLVDIFVVGMRRTPNRRLRDLLSRHLSGLSGYSEEDFLRLTDDGDGPSWDHPRRDDGRASLLDVLGQFHRMRRQRSVLLDCLFLPIIRGKMQRSLFVLPWMARCSRIADVLSHGGEEVDSAWLRSVRDSAVEGMKIVFALMDVSRKWRQVPRRKGTFAEAVMAHVLKTSVATVGSVSSYCRISRQSALGAIKLLESHGMLVEMTGRETYRVWACVP